MTGFFGYLGKIVRVRLKNGYYYLGKVIDVPGEGNSLILIDRRGHEVFVSRDAILTLEVYDG